MIDETLIMIPGPTPVSASILEALASRTPSHVAPHFVQAFRAGLDQLKQIAMADSAHPFLVAGAGTLAMEMALVNTVADGDRLLILSQGFFGDRWAEIAAAFGIECELLQADWGRVVPPEELADRLSSGRYAAVAMTHVDTSTGAAAPIRDYAELLKGRDELVLVDGVCATAGMEERFDDWGLDILLTGAQKALGTPPGLAILLASSRALSRRRERDRVAAYYADLLRWQVVMEDPMRYFSTPPVNEILAFHEAASIVLGEGLEPRFRRHARLARALRAGLEAVELGIFTDRDRLADTLTVAEYPPGIEDAAFRAEMAKRKVVVANALGPLAGRAFRVGHMGNIGAGEIGRLLQAVEDSLRSLGHKTAPGSAMAAAAPLLAEQDGPGER